MDAEVRFILGSFEVRPDQNVIVGPEGEQRLEPKAMGVLLELAAAEGRTVTREELVRAVWPQQFVTDDALNGCVSQLRRALSDDAHAPRLIATVPKVGYRLVQPCIPLGPEKSQSAVPAEASPSTGSETAADHIPSPAGRPSRLLVAGLIAAVLALAVGTWYVLRGSRSPGDGTAPLLIEKSVAVLPFTNLSDDEANAFFARGMQEEILSDLARLADLKVISRTSVMKYQGSSGRSMRDIARTLGVTYVIEGSVQRVGDRIRVTAQLIDAPRDMHLWADHYDRQVTDVFAIQSEDRRSSSRPALAARASSPRQSAHEEPGCLRAL